MLIRANLIRTRCSRESADGSFHGHQAAIQLATDLWLAHDCKYETGLRRKTPVRFTSERCFSATVKTPQQIDALKGGG